jgi:hypothetical protein
MQNNKQLKRRSILNKVSDNKTHKKLVTLSAHNSSKLSTRQTKHNCEERLACKG